MPTAAGRPTQRSARAETCHRRLAVAQSEIPTEADRRSSTSGVPAGDADWKDSCATPPSMPTTPPMNRVCTGTLSATLAARRPSHQRAEMSSRSPPPVGLATRHVASRVDQRAHTDRAKGETGGRQHGALEHRRMDLDEPASNRRHLDSRRRAGRQLREPTSRTPEPAWCQELAGSDAHPISDDAIPGPRESVHSHEVVQRLAAVVPGVEGPKVISLQELRRPEDLPRVAVTWIAIDSGPRQAHGLRRTPLQEAQSGKFAQWSRRSRALELRGGDQLLGPIQLSLSGGVGGLQQRQPASIGQGRWRQALRHRAGTGEWVGWQYQQRPARRRRPRVQELVDRHRLERPSRRVVIDDHPVSDVNDDDVVEAAWRRLDQRDHRTPSAEMMRHAGDRAREGKCQCSHAGRARRQGRAFRCRPAGCSAAGRIRSAVTPRAPQ